jgi:energy-coupling factor transport system permease protein
MSIKNIHPHTKLIIAFALIVLSFVLDYQFTFFFLIPSLGFIHLLNHSFKTWLISWSFALPYLVMLSLIVGLTFSPTQPVWINIGVFSFGEEMMFSVMMRTKSIIAILFVILTLTYHTRKDDLIASFPTPSSLGSMMFLTTSIMISLQEAQKHAKAISIAQETRGVYTTGTIMRRIKSVWPVMMPLVIHNMMTTQQRQLAYAVRGYDVHNPKTLLRQCIKTKQERLIEILTIGFTCLILLFKVIL